MRTILLIAVSLTGMLIGGCGEGGQSMLGQARMDYDAGRYSTAQEKADQAAAKSTPPVSDQAMYLAGMAAYKQNHMADAETRFMQASRSNAPEVSGRAKAMMGVVRMDQQRPREAAPFFAEAHAALAPSEPGEAKEAARHAAVAYQEAGDQINAQRWRNTAGDSASGGAGTVVMGNTTGRMNAGASAAQGAAFTLQVGAFQEKSRAEKVASECRDLADREGLGPVRVIATKDNRGKAVYLVQFGTFNSRTSAAGVRSRIGKLEYIVAPLREAT